MTALDRAFIKAYRDDSKTQSPPAEPAYHPATVVPAPHARRFFERVGAIKPDMAAIGEDAIVIEAAPPGKTIVTHELRIDVLQQQPALHISPLPHPVQVAPVRASAPAIEANVETIVEPPKQIVVAEAAPKAMPKSSPVEPAPPRLTFPKSQFQPLTPTKWPTTSMPANPFSTKAKSLAEMDSTTALTDAAFAVAPANSDAIADEQPTGSNALSDADVDSNESEESNRMPTILPLSAFRSEPTVSPFRAALEVDHFLWPSECGNLLKKAGRSFDELVKPIQQVTKQGLKCLAIASCRIGEGRTTFALTAAKHLASRGLSVVLVDADFARPNLAARLGLSIDCGWEAILAGEAQVEDVLIESLTDRLSLLPLSGPLAVENFTRNLRGATMLGVLRQHYDLVLLDAGAQEGDGRDALDAIIESSQIDAAFLLRDVRRTTQADLTAVEKRLQGAKILCLGVAENFCSL